MFIVTLTYCKPLSDVDRYIDAHIVWLEENYGRGIFLLSGRRVPRIGGFILASGLSRPELDDVLARDPFHMAGVAHYEVIEVMPSMAAERLAWLTRQASP